jgi:hypothetical protein
MTKTIAVNPAVLLAARITAECDDTDDEQVDELYEPTTDEPPTGLLALCARAARAGDLDSLQRLCKTAPTLKDARICKAAARGGHEATLEWLLDNGFLRNEDTCAAAAKGGHLAALQLLRSRDCRWDHITGCMAARKGHLAVLEWTILHGGRWCADTCSWAAQEGRLEVLQWLHAHGCPWNEDTPLSAEDRFPAVAAWAVAHGCPRLLPRPSTPTLTTSTVPSDLGNGPNLMVTARRIWCNCGLLVGSPRCSCAYGLAYSA